LLVSKPTNLPVVLLPSILKGGNELSILACWYQASIFPVMNRVALYESSTEYWFFRGGYLCIQSLVSFIQAGSMTTRITYPGNGEVCYQYDPDGRLTRIGCFHANTAAQCRGVSRPEFSS